MRLLLEDTVIGGTTLRAGHLYEPGLDPNIDTQLGQAATVEYDAATMANLRAGFLRQRDIQGGKAAGLPSLVGPLLSNGLIGGGGGGGLPPVSGLQYAVLMEDPGGNLVFQRLTEDMIQAGFAISSYAKTAPNGAQLLYRRGDTLTGLAAAMTYSSTPDAASIVNVLGGSVGGGDINPGLWTVDPSPFLTATMGGSVKRDGSDLGADPTLTATLTATLGALNPTAAFTVQWTRDVYFGVGPAGLNTEGQIEALAGSALQTGRARTITVSPSNEKVYYAYPQAYGAATFTLNGFPAAFTLTTSISITNSNGITSTYDIYESDNLLTGTGLNFIVT